MTFNIFNFINIAIVVLVILPELMGRARQRLPYIGGQRSINDFIFSASKFVSMALMIMPVMVKGGQLFFEENKTMYIWLITVIVMLIVYYVCWWRFPGSEFEQWMVAGILVLPCVIFLETGLRFKHTLLIFASAVYLVMAFNTFSKYVETKERLS